MPISWTKDEVIERIKQLMNYASDGSASEGEIENALGKARRLMDKFNVDEADVYKTEQARNTAYDSIVDVQAYSRAGKIDYFDRVLARSATLLCDCKLYRSESAFDQNGQLWRDRKGRPQTREILHFYGLPRDVEVAKAIYMELLATMRAMARFRLGEGWRAEFSSYCHGFSDRIYSRAQTMKDESIAESNTTAIVLCKGDMLTRFATEKLNLSPGRVSRAGRNVNSEIYEKGNQDGSRVSLARNGLPAGKQSDQGRLE